MVLAWCGHRTSKIACFVYYFLKMQYYYYHHHYHYHYLFIYLLLFFFIFFIFLFFFYFFFAIIIIIIIIIPIIIIIITGDIIQDVDPCQKCVCQQGQKTCQKVSCPLYTCQNPVTKPGTCCPSCPPPTNDYQGRPQMEPMFGDVGDNENRHLLYLKLYL